MRHLYAVLERVAADRRHRARRGRDGHRQGAGGPRHPRRVARGATGPSSCRLRRHPGEPRRERALRPRAGAFTGASRDRRGLFEQADGGTLFLDEIGELPLDLQAKLLRALRDARGPPRRRATSPRVDVRVVAATNRDLAARSTPARFREDLYYRLAVVAVDAASRCARAARTSRCWPQHFYARLAAGAGRAAARLRSAARSRGAGPATCASCATSSSAACRSLAAGRPSRGAPRPRPPRPGAESLVPLHLPLTRPLARDVERFEERLRPGHAAADPAVT